MWNLPFEFINYKDILNSVDQMQVWSWLLNKHIEPGEFITNDLREDNHAGCWIEDNGLYARIKDYARQDEFHNLNIFDATMLKYNCDLQAACQLIYKNCILKQGQYLRKDVQKFKRKPTFKFKLSFTPKVKESTPIFTKKDKQFWQKLNIPRTAIEGEVLSNYCYSKNSKKSPHTINTYFPRDLSYTYTFPSGRKKIYHPQRTTVTKWIADVTREDIWFKDYEVKSDILIITKSYIDGKLIQLSTGYNVEALQNEGCKPPLSDITRWINSYKHIFFLYDIDVAGIKASKNLVDYCNSIYEGMFSSIFLPFYLFSDYQITDSKEIVLHKSFGYNAMEDFVNYSIEEKLVNYAF